MGHQEALHIAGDKLNSWKDLQKIGSDFSIQSPVKDAKTELLEKLWNLEEEGATALGPALLLGISVAGNRSRSKVILCTDGLANTGLGSLEGKQTEYTPYYSELAEQAKIKGVTVSVMSLIGTECSLESLSIVTEQTGGEIERVDPVHMNNNLTSIISNPVIAYGVMGMVLLHKGLHFRGEMDDERENRNWVVKDLGNVTAESGCSFSYGFRPKEDCDLSSVKEIPFQVQLLYTLANGMQCLRVATTSVKLTEDRQEAEENADIEVVSGHAAIRAAKLAKKGDYEAAQLEARAAQRFMMRNKVEEKRLNQWSTQAESMDKVLRSEQAQELRDNSRQSGGYQKQKSRQVTRNDEAAEAISKQSKAKNW